MRKLSEIFSLDDEDSVRWLLKLSGNRVHTKEGTTEDWARLTLLDFGIYKAQNQVGQISYYYRDLGKVKAEQVLL